MNDGWLTFECTNPDCGEARSYPPAMVLDAAFDPDDILCDDCIRALIPADVLAMRPAPSFAPLPGMEDAHRVRTEYFRWRSLHARNRVRSTGDWRSYQRAMRAYAELEG